MIEETVEDSVQHGHLHFQEPSYAIIDIINNPWADNTSANFKADSKRFDIPFIGEHNPFLLEAPVVGSTIMSFAFTGTISVTIVVSSFEFTNSSSSFAPLNQVVVVKD